MWKKHEHEKMGRSKKLRKERRWDERKNKD